MTRPASTRSRVAPALGALASALGPALALALLGWTGPARAQPPVTIQSPGLPESGWSDDKDTAIQWMVYHRSGWKKMDRGWYDSAEREFLASIRVARRAPADVRTRLLAQSYASLAWAMQEQGKGREAEPLARWALGVWRSEHGDASAITARGVNLVATIVLGLDRRAEAEALLRPMVAVDPKQSDALRQEQGRGLSLLGLALAGGGRYTEAEVAYQRAVSRREALGPRDDATLGDDWNNLAWCRIEQRKLAEGRTAMDRALALLESSRGTNDPTVARALDGLARIDAEQGDLGAAEAKLRRALGIYEAAGPPLRPRLADDLGRLAALLDRAQRPREAEAARARLARLASPNPTSASASASATAPRAAPPLAPPAPPRAPASSPRR